MIEDYIPRLFNETLKFAFKSKGAVLFVGSKWRGKQHQEGKLKLISIYQMKKHKNNILNLLKASPAFFVQQGERPLLIDEWQEISFIWNSIKKAVDDSHSFGQFILTGSVIDKTVLKESSGEWHTGTRLIVRKMMRTMSLFESGDSNGKVSLLNLKDENLKHVFQIRNWRLCLLHLPWWLDISNESRRRCCFATSNWLLRRKKINSNIFI